jgi:hypothetical protein
MFLQVNLIVGFSIIKLLHMSTSVTFLVITIWLYIRSFNGIFKDKPYMRLDKILSYGFIISLYLQLIFGVILFSNLESDTGFNYLSADKSLKIVSKRLWPLEHIVLMLFALIIANLGLFITINSRSDKSKYRYSLIYYSVSILLIIFSLCIIYL